MTSAGNSEGYAYYAGGMLRQSTLGNDALSFYYASGAHPRVASMAQGATGKRSARLGAARFLCDGTEQVLCSRARIPRRHPAAGTVSAYGYDPFGAQPRHGGEATATTGFDLAQNPFQYAGEYRDPLWGGIYLRARWYHPDLPSFISRDPAQNLNRFAYAGGNPVMHIDPGGKNFLHGLERVLQGMNKKLNHGVGGCFAGFLLAPLMGPLAIAANPKAFWEGIKTNRDGMDEFLALGVASEFFGGWMDSAAVKDVLRLSRATRWGRRMFSDLVIGVGQSVAAGASRGFKQFDGHSFGMGLSMTAGVPLLWRGILGLNVPSGYRSGAKTLSILDDFHTNAADREALIFRVKEPPPASQRWLKHLPVPKDSPLGDALGLGLYHERVLAITTFTERGVQVDELFGTELFDTGLVRRHLGPQFSDAARERMVRSSFQYEYVGRVQNFDPHDFYANPRQVNLSSKDNPRAGGEPAAGGGTNTYHVLTNDCHHRAYWT